MKDEKKAAEEVVVAESPVIDRAFLEANHPDLVQKIRADGATAERERILKIHALDAKGFDEIKAEMMADPTATSGDAAERILAARGEQEAKRAKAVQDSLEEDEGDVEALASASIPNEDLSTEDQLAASVLKWMPSAQAVNAAEA